MDSSKEVEEGREEERGSEELHEMAFCLCGVSAGVHLPSRIAFTQSMVVLVIHPFITAAIIVLPSPVGYDTSVFCIIDVYDISS